MPRDLSRKEVLDRRMEHVIKTEKEAAKAVPQGAKDYAQLYEDVPNGVVDHQSKVIDLLTPDAKSLVIGYALLGMIEWAAQVMIDSGKPEMTGEVIKRQAIKKAIDRLRDDGLFEFSTPVDGVVQPGPTIIKP